MSWISPSLLPKGSLTLCMGKHCQSEDLELDVADPSTDDVAFLGAIG